MTPAVVAAAVDLPPLTPARLVSVWALDPYLIVPLLAVTAAYLAGVHRLSARGVPWPAGRTAAYLAGVATLAVATMSAMGAYDDTVFSIHMAQHMVLTMLAPVLFALAAPTTLALRTLPPGPRQMVLAALHSRVFRVLSHPLVAFPLFVGSLYVLYWTPLYELTLRHLALHELLHVHFVLVGCLFFFPLVGIDPMPHGLPHPARLGLIFLMLPLHAWLGIELMATGSVIAGDYYAAVPNHAGNLLADQHLGGALLWGSGDLLSALFFGALLMQWMRAEERAAARGDRRAAAAAAAGREGAELAAYNAYLARLHAGDRPAHRDS